MFYFLRRFSHRHPLRSLSGVAALLRSRVTAASLVIVISLIVYAGSFAEKNTFVISHENGITVHATYTQDPRIVLMEAGIHIGENDYVSLPEGLVSGTAAEIEIIRAKTVHVYLDGETHKVITLGGTVADALRKLGYVRGSLDLVVPETDRRIEDGMSVTVTRFALRPELEQVFLPFESETVITKDLEPGVERIVRAGAEGLREIEFSLTLRDGEEIDRRLVRDEIVRAPVTELIEVGAERSTRGGHFPGKNAELPKANAGTLTLPDGTVLAYTHTLNAEATAYTTERQKSKTNASGKIARVGTIAVDPRVIPLGTLVYIVAADGSWVYGTAVCEDTGGAVKGNIIDLFFDRYDECISFGRRNATVYILKSA